MSEVTRTLPLGEEVLEALRAKRNAESAVLGWLEDFERWDWEGCDAEALANNLDQRRYGIHLSV
jgi:c-di-GMP-related signal transduction protein